MNVNGDARPTTRPPLWTTLLIALGWLFAAASVAAGVASWFRQAAYIEALKAPTQAENIAIVAIALAIGGIGFGIGMILITIACVGRPGSRPGRLVIWAKFCVIVGLELCAGLPLLLYGVMLLGMAFVRDPTEEPLDPWGLRVFLTVGILIVVPVVIGLAMIAVAWIWGRRKSTNLPDVFG